MKKAIYLTGLLSSIITIILCATIYCLFFRGSDTVNEYMLGSIYDYPFLIESKFFPDNGCVPDANTAVKIADAVLLSIYDEEINDEKPYIVTYDSELSLWIIEGQLPNDPDLFGGVAYIAIQKSDGKVLYITHTK